MRTPRLTAAILAGGASERMGLDKALLQRGSESLLERAVRVAHSVCDEVVVLGRSHAPYPAAALPDVGPPRGPGEAVARAVSMTGPLLIVAVDLVNIEALQLAQLRAIWGGRDHGVVTREASGRLLPTLSVVTPLDIQASRPRPGSRGRSLHELVQHAARLQLAVSARMLRGVNRPSDARSAGLLRPDGTPF